MDLEGLYNLCQGDIHPNEGKEAKMPSGKVYQVERKYWSADPDQQYFIYNKSREEQYLHRDGVWRRHACGYYGTLRQVFATIYRAEKGVEAYMQIGETVLFSDYDIIQKYKEILVCWQNPCGFAPVDAFTERAFYRIKKEIISRGLEKDLNVNFYPMKHAGFATLSIGNFNLIDLFNEDQMSDIIDMMEDVYDQQRDKKTYRSVKRTYFDVLSKYSDIFANAKIHHDISNNREACNNIGDLIMKAYTNFVEQSPPVFT